jgi:hypothetical protein
MTKTDPKPKNRSSIPVAHPPNSKPKGLFETKSLRETLEAYNKENVIFSWKYFDWTHPYFNCGGMPEGWFLSLMETLKNVSSMKFSEFKKSGGPPLRVHHHEWDKVSAKFPFNQQFLEQIESDTYQFAISTGNGRVHGFTRDNVFYIVWLDPHHNLYPQKEPKEFPPPTCWDEYEQQRIFELEEQVKELEKFSYLLMEQLEQTKASNE